MYAKDTTVSVARSKAEIENTVCKYGASGFISGWNDDAAMIAFEMRGRRVKFILPLPSKSERRFTHRSKRRGRSSISVPRTPDDSAREWEKVCRQRFRALALAVKAKLEMVESGITTFEQEFLAHLVLPNGRTVGEATIPSLEAAMIDSKLPPLLPGPVQ
jgi:hypothetical protein